MNTTHQLFGRLLVVAMALALVAGCVDEDETSATNDGQEQNQQQNQQDGDDCDDGFFLHPITDECVEESDNDDGNEQDCDVDQQFDDDAQECVDRCTPDEFWDEDDEQCVDISNPGDCADFEEWDEDSEQCVPTGECGPGSLIGESCRPDLGVLPGATIEIEGVDCDGMPYEEQTTADDQGIYEFDDVPAGTHDLTITSGSWSETDEVTINKGIQTDLTDETAKICVGSTSVEIAVIPGTWDDIPGLLDGMDIEYDMINDAESFATDLDALEEYDIIFAECGAAWDSFSWDADMDVVESNYRRFVEEGNSLYASDLAYDYVEDSLANSFTSDFGGPTGTYTLDVVSTEMLNLLGQDTIDIDFNTGGWRGIESVGPTSTVHFEGDLGMGPDDTPAMFSYDDPIGDGRAIYTSFHNSAQATGDMQEILEFMIFQL